MQHMPLTMLSLLSLISLDWLDSRWLSFKEIWLSPPCLCSWAGDAAGAYCRRRAVGSLCLFAPLSRLAAAFVDADPMFEGAPQCTTWANGSLNEILGFVGTSLATTWNDANEFYKSGKIFSNSHLSIVTLP